MSMFNFVTVQDVHAAMSGFLDWEFNGSASFADFCEWVYRNHNSEKYDNMDPDSQISRMMFDYLESRREEARDYISTVKYGRTA